MRDLWTDLRHGLRVLTKNPGFTFVALVALALGIGANTAIFSVVHAVLLRPLPYNNPDRLVTVFETEPELAKTPVTPADFLDWREQNRVFAHLAAIQWSGFNLTGGSVPERIRGAKVSVDFFATLGVQPELGRGFLPQEESPGADQIVVLSHGLWGRRFGKDPGIIGKTLTLDGRSFTVIGVMPAGFRDYVTSAELWTPLAFGDKAKKVRDTHYLGVIGRLKPGITQTQAQGEMETIAETLQQQYPDTNTGVGIRLVPLQTQVVGDVRPALLVLLGSVAFVLLIACANVANLLLARAAARQREVATRVALGASRLRIVRQFLTESLVLAILGGLLGLLLAHWGLQFLVFLKPTNIPRLTEIGIDGRVLAFTLLASFLTGIVFGVLPALQISNSDPNEFLKEGDRAGTAGPGRTRLRDVLVISEVALAFSLLLDAGLMIRSFARIQEVAPGFNPQNVLTMAIPLPPYRYAESAKRTAFFQQVLERVKQLPGAQYAGVTTDLPLTGGGTSTDFLIKGQPAPSTPPLTDYHSVSPDYFRAMQITLQKGRYFTERDTNDRPPVVIINETLARRFFPNRDPIGQWVGLSGPPDWREIVGVVGDVKDLALESGAEPAAYVPYLQNSPAYLSDTSYSMALVVRTENDPTVVASAVRHEILTVDKDQPVSSVMTMEQVVADSISFQRVNMWLLGIFAGLALAIATAGIYGVMAYSVTQRAHEIGIRMALGARRRDVLRLVLGQGLMLACVGISLGLIAALALARTMKSLLYSVQPTDPLTLAGVSLLFAAIAFIAAYFPARRATKVDPTVTLRYE
jgi:putative ABC transport system permease protein